MNQITPEGIALALEDILDDEFVADGQECHFQFATATDATVSVIVVGEDNGGTAFTLTVESAADGHIPQGAHLFNVLQDARRQLKQMRSLHPAAHWEADWRRDNPGLAGLVDAADAFAKPKPEATDLRAADRERPDPVIVCSTDSDSCTCGAPVATPAGMHHTNCPTNPESRLTAEELKATSRRVDEVMARIRSVPVAACSTNPASSLSAEGDS